MQQPPTDFRTWYEAKHNMPYPCHGHEPFGKVREQIAEAVADWLDLLATTGPPERREDWRAWLADIRPQALPLEEPSLRELVGGWTLLLAPIVAGSVLIAWLAWMVKTGG